jgi:hypothetical protein
VALLTDGRFSGGIRGAAIGHISPEAAEGGPIAVVRNGDQIEIDIPGRKLNLLISNKELKKRLFQWKPPKKKLKGYSNDMQGWSPLRIRATFVTNADSNLSFRMSDFKILHFWSLVKPAILPLTLSVDRGFSTLGLFRFLPFELQTFRPDGVGLPG